MEIEYDKYIMSHYNIILGASESSSIFLNHYQLTISEVMLPWHFICSSKLIQFVFIFYFFAKTNRKCIQNVGLSNQLVMKVMQPENKANSGEDHVIHFVFIVLIK